MIEKVESIRNSAAAAGWAACGARRDDVRFLTRDQLWFQYPKKQKKLTPEWNKPPLNRGKVGRGFVMGEPKRGFAAVPLLSGVLLNIYMQTIDEF